MVPTSDCDAHWRRYCALNRTGFGAHAVSLYFTGEEQEWVMGKGGLNGRGNGERWIEWEGTVSVVMLDRRLCLGVS